MNARKTIRILQVTLGLVLLLVFTTVLTSGWHHHSSANDSQCPYCHLDHQTAGHPQAGQRVAALCVVDSLPRTEDFYSVAAPISSHSSSRAPPAA
jgi:hypothetical protein